MYNGEVNASVIEGTWILPYVHYDKLDWFHFTDDQRRDIHTFLYVNKFS